MALPDTAPARSRRGWVRWVRLLVSGVLLAVLISKMPGTELVPSNRSLPGTLAFLISGFVLMAVSFVLASWRWQRVLAVFGEHIPLRRLLSHYLAGQFVGNVLPSTVGGDVLRISRCSKDMGSREVAFASVVLERMTGFVALPLLALLGFLIRPDLLDTGRAWIALVIALATVGMLALLLALAGSPRLAGRFKDHENWMRYIGAIHVGVDGLRHDQRDAAYALGASIAYQTSVVAAVYCAVHTVGLTIPNAAVIAFVPAVAMAQVVPISVGGLGVREGMLALLLHPLGVPTGQAVAVGLLWYAMTLIVSLAGAPAFAIGHRHAAGSPQAAAAGDGR
jgi:uncharacterized protein (TIRG00374 family)